VAKAKKLSSKKKSARLKRTPGQKMAALDRKMRRVAYALAYEALSLHEDVEKLSTRFYEEFKKHGYWYPAVTIEMSELSELGAAVVKENFESAIPCPFIKSTVEDIDIHLVERRDDVTYLGYCNNDPLSKSYDPLFD